MKEKIYLFISVLSFLISQVPLYLASIDSVYTSYCDTDAWFELQKCLLNPITAIIGAIIFYILSFILMLIIYKIHQYIFKLKEKK